MITVYMFIIAFIPHCVQYYLWEIMYFFAYKSSASEEGAAKIVLARVFVAPSSLRERPFMSKSSCVSSGECRRHDFANGAD